MPRLGYQVRAVGIAGGTEDGVDGAGRSAHQVACEKNGQEARAFRVGAWPWIEQAPRANEAGAAAKFVGALRNGFNDPYELRGMLRERRHGLDAPGAGQGRLN